MRRFACFQAIDEERQGEDWRIWPTICVTAQGRPWSKSPSRLKDRVEFALFLQWLADRQLARASARARSGGLELGLYRDLAIGAAPDGAEAWARADELIDGVSLGRAA